MFSRFLRRFRPAAFVTPKPCPFCDDLLLEQAKQQLAAGYFVGAIASARCHLSRQLLSTCKGLKAFTSSKQRKRPKLTSMSQRLHNAGFFDQDTHNQIINFANRAAIVLDGGKRCNASQAWKAIDCSVFLSRLIRTSLLNYKEHGSPSDEKASDHSHRHLDLDA